MKISEIKNVAVFDVDCQEYPCNKEEGFKISSLLSELRQISQFPYRLVARKAKDDDKKFETFIIAHNIDHDKATEFSNNPLVLSFCYFDHNNIYELNAAKYISDDYFGNGEYPCIPEMNHIRNLFNTGKYEKQGYDLDSLMYLISPRPSYFSSGRRWAFIDLSKVKSKRYIVIKTDGSYEVRNSSGDAYKEISHIVNGREGFESTKVGGCVMLARNDCFGAEFTKKEELYSNYNAKATMLTGAAEYGECVACKIILSASDTDYDLDFVCNLTDEEINKALDIMKDAYLLCPYGVYCSYENSIGCEAHISMSEEQAEKMGCKNIIGASLPNSECVFNHIINVPEDIIVSSKGGFMWAEYCIKKENIEKALRSVYPYGNFENGIIYFGGKPRYNYGKVLDLIDGDCFYLTAIGD